MKHTHTSQKGFVLVLSLFISTIVLTIMVGMMTILYKQIVLSTTGRESLVAFYAADTGLECAYNWDIYHLNSNDSVFLSSSSARSSSTFTANCVSQNVMSGTVMTCSTSGSDQTCTFTLSNIGTTGCAVVTVLKKATPLNGYTTFIESHGRNRCSTTDPRTVERAIEFRY